MWDLTKIGEDYKISEDQLRSDDYHNFVWKLIMSARDTEHSDFYKDDIQLWNSFLLQNRMYFNCVDKNNDINLLKQEIAEFKTTVKQHDEIIKTELFQEIAELKETVCIQNNAVTQVELLRKEIDILKSALEKNEYKTNEFTVLTDKIQMKSTAQQEQEMLKNRMEETKLAMQKETEVFQQEIEVIKSNMQQEKEMLQIQVHEIKSQVQESMLTKGYVKQKNEEITDQVDDIKEQVEHLTGNMQNILKYLREESLAAENFRKMLKQKEYELNELITEIQKLNGGMNELNEKIETVRKNVGDIMKGIKQSEEFQTEITAKVNATETLVSSLGEKHTTLKDELKEHFDIEFLRVIKLTPVIPGLDKVVLEACDTENWKKCKSFLRQYLPENCAAYQQLLKVKGNVLFCAVKYDYEELIAVILKNGFKINNIVVKKYCQTLCHIAAEYGNGKMVKFLIAQGADIEARDSIGYTPLHYACHWGHVDVVNLLLQKGALINVKTDFNSTPLHLAARYSHVSVIQLLDLHLCDKKVENNNGDTAYDEFIQYSENNIEELLNPDLNTF